MAQFQPGQRVTATIWGEKRKGTVLEQGTIIVWVQWDGQASRRWAHPESLTLIK